MPSSAGAPSPNTPAPRGKGRLARLAVLLATLAGAAVAAELGLRLVGFRLPAPVHAGDLASRPSSNFEPDPVTGWRLVPGHVFPKPDPTGTVIEYRSDADGFRCGATPASVGPAAPLLVVAGDSFAFGWDVPHEDAFGSLLAARLGWRLCNVSMPGFGLDQIWLSVRERGLPRRPSLVVVALFLEDFERSRTAYRTVEGFTKPRFLLRDGALAPETPADAPGALGRWFEALRLVRFLDASLRHAGRFVELGPWWNLNAALLAALRDDCRAANVPLLVLFVPDDHWRSFPALGRHLARAGVDALDPVALHPDPPPHLYFEATGQPEHLATEGHRFLAELLAAWCAEHGIGGR